MSLYDKVRSALEEYDEYDDDVVNYSFYNEVKKRSLVDLLPNIRVALGDFCDFKAKMEEDFDRQEVVLTIRLTKKEE